MSIAVLFFIWYFVAFAMLVYSGIQLLRMLCFSVYIELQSAGEFLLRYCNGIVFSLVVC